MKFMYRKSLRVNETFITIFRLYSAKDNNGGGTKEIQPNLNVHSNIMFQLSVQSRPTGIRSVIAH